MVFRIVIAGETQCIAFHQSCLVADYLSHKLSNFYYERIEKSVNEWTTWLNRINQKNKWHHCGSPIIWKELLIKGSKAYYIGGTSEFLDYCDSYYKFDSFLAPDKIENLIGNITQYRNKIKNKNITCTTEEAGDQPKSKTNFSVCIFGCSSPLTMYLIHGLLGMTECNKSISKIYIYDDKCSEKFLESVENECSYVSSTLYSGKVVKYVEKIGLALTISDLLIILDYVPFEASVPIGDWLSNNKSLMIKIALMINASASRRIRILFPNIGPSCYNATILRNAVYKFFKKNIVVATSDLGLEISNIAAEMAEIPVKNMFCPPVWGFVGINHLVDIKNTVHKYNSFEPYQRYIKVINSPLTIGRLTPEMRTLEYLFHFDEKLWKKVANIKAKYSNGQIPINKAVAVLDVVKIWLFHHDTNEIVNLAVLCDGSFGLNFKGLFSQPCTLKDGFWIPARDYSLPKDPYMKLNYLESIAESAMNLRRKELPEIVSYYPCTCKLRMKKKKFVW